MRLVPFAAILLATGPAANGQAPYSVLLAGSRSGWIEAMDLQDLNTVSRVRVPDMTEDVGSDGSGRRLFLRAPKSAGTGCCALFALDTHSLLLTPLDYPAGSITATAYRLFTQRGNVGMEVFDLQSLNRFPTIRAPGIYRLRPAPDNRLMIGLANWPKPSLDLFDASQGVLIDHLAILDASRLSGAWLGQRYFVLTVNAGEATVRAVDVSSGKFGAPALSSPLVSFPVCEPAAYDVVPSGGKLVIYAQLGLTSDGACAASSGGFFLYDPDSGSFTSRNAPDVKFRQLLRNSDGRYLYGLDIGFPAWQRVRIVKIDAKSGEVVVEKSLAPGVWNLSMGAISPEMRGQVGLSVSLPAN